MVSCSVLCESKKKGWNIFSSMLPLMSVISLAGMVISDMILNAGRFDSPVSDMMAPAMILIFSPSEARAYSRKSVFFPVLMTVLALTVSVIRIAMMMTSRYYPVIEYLPALLAFIMLVFLGIRSVSKTASPVIKDLHLAIFFALLIVAVYDGKAPGKIPLLLLFGSSALFYLYTYVLLRQGNRPVRCRKRGDAGLKSVQAKTGDEKADNMELLYSRLRTLFEEEKPYLDENITVGDIARRLYTNKAYLSRAIKEHAGKNFCQYVNHYRIMYAMEAFRENPWLRVAELADISGFHTIVSFNMAFRLVTDESPGEWCKRVRLEQEPKNNMGH